jgi:hypothetical protein
VCIFRHGCSAAGRSNGTDRPCAEPQAGLMPYFTPVVAGTFPRRAQRHWRGSRETSVARTLCARVARNFSCASGVTRKFSARAG